MARAATHVVDANRDSDGFTTVGAAIRAASSGDRIFVRPGRYEESLLIDKPLEIIGDGPLARIEIVGTFDHVLNFRAETGLVVNLTLSQPSGPPHQGVFIARGQLHLEGCDIGSRTGSGVYILGGSKPILRRNVIHFAMEVGVLFQKGSGGTLEDNEITGCGLDGVEVQAGSDPVLRRNVIRDSRKHGVLFDETARGTLEDNEIAGSQLCGVKLEAGSDPVLRRNVVRDSQQNGVLFDKTARGTLEDNEIAGSQLDGVEVQAGSDPVLQRNVIRDGQKYGVYVHEDGRGTFEENQITGNEQSGVAMAGSPTLRGNRITGNRWAGIQAWGGGGGLAEDNDLTGNGLGAWELDWKTKHRITRARNKEK
jgi:parallel beta-helix repeat protein